MPSPVGAGEVRVWGLAQGCREGLQGGDIGEARGERFPPSLPFEIAHVLRRVVPIFVVVQRPEGWTRRFPTGVTRVQLERDVVVRLAGERTPDGGEENAGGTGHGGQLTRSIRMAQPGMCSQTTPMLFLLR